MLALPRSKRPFGIFSKVSRRHSIAVFDHHAPPSEAQSDPPHVVPMVPENSLQPPTKASLKAWLNQFTFAKKESAISKTGQYYRIHRLRAASNDTCALPGEPVHTVFGKPLRESLKYASVQISTANANGELYVWGYIPVVVAKWYVHVIHSPPSSIHVIQRIAVCT